MTAKIPTYVCELVSKTDSLRVMRRYLDNIEKEPEGAALVYQDDGLKSIEVSTFTLKPCGFVDEPSLLNHIRDGVQFQATKGKVKEMPQENNIIWVMVMVQFTPLEADEVQESIKRRESLDA